MINVLDNNPKHNGDGGESLKIDYRNTQHKLYVTRGSHQREGIADVFVPKKPPHKVCEASLNKKYRKYKGGECEQRLVPDHLLRRTAQDRALAGVLLLAWNPLILYETLGQGHNDVVMLFCILACVGCLACGRHTLAVLALVAGALLKFVPLMLLPAAGLVSLRGLPGTKARLRFAAVTACAAMILVLLAYAPFWSGLETLGIERRRELFTTSLPAVIYVLLEGPLGEERAASMVSLAAATITALFALWQGVRASRDPSWQSFVQAALAILMFYLLFTCLWFQQWYSVWPLGLVPLLPTGHMAWLGVSFGFAVLSKPLFFEPLWLWPHPSPDRSWLELRLGPAVLALPWLLTLVAVWVGRRTRFPRAPSNERSNVPTSHGHCPKGSKPASPGNRNQPASRFSR